MSKILIVGGDRSGELVTWLGNRARINRVSYVLHRAYFKDGTRRQYYVQEGLRLDDMLHLPTMDWVEVCQ